MNEIDEIVRVLINDGCVVMRTDTIYGVLARADSEAAVERVYALKGRTQTKSPIVLIASPDQMYDDVTKAQSDFVERCWPGKVSIITSSHAAPLWIRRGNDSVAYRMPDHELLRAIIAQTGSLIAPSANPEGEPPATTITQAMAYFGNSVSFYVDGGEVVNNQPSQLFSLNHDGTARQLR